MEKKHLIIPALVAGLLSASATTFAQDHYNGGNRDTGSYGQRDRGDNRSDKIYTLEGDVIYKMTRNLWIKGTLRRDILDSNIVGAGSASTLVMLGVRMQN